MEILGIGRGWVGNECGTERRFGHGYDRGMIWHAWQRNSGSPVNTQDPSHVIKFLLKSALPVVTSEPKSDDATDVLLSIASTSARRGSPEKVNNNVGKDHNV